MDENSTSPVAATGPSSSNEFKRKSDSAPKARSAKRAKINSTAPIAKEERIQINDLKRELRAAQELVPLQAARITRLEGKEYLQKKSYEELKTKSDQKLDGHDALRDLKLTTFNHFVATWEITNLDKERDKISELKNAFPRALRKHVSKEIEKNKDALKSSSKNQCSQK